MRFYVCRLRLAYTTLLSATLLSATLLLMSVCLLLTFHCIQFLLRQSTIYKCMYIVTCFYGKQQNNSHVVKTHPALTKVRNPILWFIGSVFSYVLLVFYTTYHGSTATHIQYNTMLDDFRRISKIRVAHFKYTSVCEPVKELDNG